VALNETINHGRVAAPLFSLHLRSAIEMAAPLWQRRIVLPAGWNIIMSSAKRCFQYGTRRSMFVVNLGEKTEQVPQRTFFGPILLILSAGATLEWALPSPWSWSLGGQKRPEKPKGPKGNSLALLCRPAMDPKEKSLGAKWNDYCRREIWTETGNGTFSGGVCGDTKLAGQQSRATIVSPHSSYIEPRETVHSDLQKAAPKERDVCVWLWLGKLLGRACQFGARV